MLHLTLFLTLLASTTYASPNKTSCLTDAEWETVRYLEPSSVARLMDDKQCNTVAEGIDFGALADQADFDAEAARKAAKTKN